MTTRRLLLLSSLLIASASANAGWSANIGWASDYYFRGIFQKSSSASAGLDYDSNGFYVGTWIADVDGAFGDGLEVDGYFGYGGDIGDFGYAVGFTGYYYTGDFDDTYQEINLNGSYGWVSIDAAIGEYQNFNGPIQDYQYYSVTVEKNGLYGKYGVFQDEASGSYVELGYGATVSEIDFGLYFLSADGDLSGELRSEALVFTVGKAFDLN
jgi:uncharacterized protein (TIGR02001 family)